MRQEISERLSKALAEQLLPPLAEATGPDPLADRTLPATFAALADLYPSLLVHDLRKQHGAWFTPMALAEPTAARALTPLLDRGGELRIVDPAVGGGTFM
ncbi:MAG: hypothetical protein WAT39_11090, partial [Planctomycetota bacterium]